MDGAEVFFFFFRKPCVCAGPPSARTANENDWNDGGRRGSRSVTFPDFLGPLVPHSDNRRPHKPPLQRRSRFKHSNN